MELVEGNWWLPEDPAHRVDGILEKTFERYSLKLKVPLGGRPLHDLINNPDSATSGLELVLGETSSGLVSLTRPGSSAVEIRDLGRLTGTLKIEFDGLLLGLHLKEPDETFGEFEFSSLGMERLLGRNRPSGSEAGMAFREVAIAGLGTVVLYWETIMHKASEVVWHSYRPVLRLISDSPLTIGEAWSAFISPALFFFSFAIGGSDRSGLFRVRRTSSTNFGEVQKSRWSAGEIRQGGVHPYDRSRFLIHTDDLLSDFGGLLGRWFEMYSRTANSFVDLFVPILEPSLFADESFLRTVRSLESFHKAFLEVDRSHPRPLSSKEFKLMKLKIQEVVTAEQRAFVSERLKNDPTLAQRIEFVIQTAGGEASSILNGYAPDFESKVVRTRNGLSHSGRKGENFSWVELYCARNSVMHVLLGALLAGLGFDLEEVGQRLARSELHEELKSARNPLTLTQA